MTIFDYIDRHPVLSWAWWIAGLFTILVVVAEIRAARPYFWSKPADPKDRPS